MEFNDVTIKSHKGRKRGSLYDHFSDTEEIGFKSKRFKCNYCGKTMQQDASRMRKHLLQICTSIPLEIREAQAALIQQEVNQEILANNIAIGEPFTSRIHKQNKKRRKIFDPNATDSPEEVPLYGHPLMGAHVPRRSFPQHSIPSKVAYQAIKDELSLDGNPKMNLASFVTTFMEPEGEKLMIEGMRKNYIDLDQYPQTADIHERCVSMLANLFHAPLNNNEKPVGTGCIGSSEAIMLAGLAMKRKWKDRRKAQGKSYEHPNIVFGANVQICWHKMCKYFEIECREARLSPEELVLTPERARPLIDENTIGICAILGSTINGEFEDVEGLHELVVELNNKFGWEVPIHVDAASGGFIAPFLSPDLLWDFRLPYVKSINVSGHKFGLVYAGIGWALWREKSDLPEDLVFHVNYLGGDQSSFTLNFSKGAGNVIGQYYNFLRLGRDGYTRIMRVSMSNAEYLRDCLIQTGLFSIVDKGEMPLVAFSLIDSSRFTCFDIQDKLRARGWIVPAYTCPKGAESLVIMRVVVKQNFSHDMADMLMKDIVRIVSVLEEQYTTLSAIKNGYEALKKEAELKAKTIGHSLNHRKSGIQTYGVC